jgi:hypothetical protein
LLPSTKRVNNKGERISEVTEFLSRNPDIGAEFREFALRYETLADVWKNCPRSNWMFRILNRCNYRNGEKLEGYIDWLSEQIDDANESALEEIRQRYFNYKGYVKQLEIEGQAGKLPQTEVRRRRFIWTRIVAEHATGYVLDNKVARAQFDKFTERFLIAVAGEDSQIPDFDEIEIRLVLLKEQADKLRESMGNPFEFPAVDDFYYGKGIG